MPRWLVQHIAMATAAVRALDARPGATSKGNSSDWVHDEIKARIVTLRLRPGEKVTEEELVAVVGGGVSKTPVREALRWLVRDGFITRDGRSYMVTPITVRGIRDLYDLRVVLEEAVIDRVLTRGSSVTAVEELVATESRFSLDQADPDSIRHYLCEADTIHMTLARLSGYRELAACLSATLEKLQPAMQIMLRCADAEDLDLCQHSALFAAIAAKDHTRARTAVVEHIRASERLVLETLLDLHGEVVIPPELYASPRRA